MALEAAGFQPPARQPQARTSQPRPPNCLPVPLSPSLTGLRASLTAPKSSRSRPRKRPASPCATCSTPSTPSPSSATPPSPSGPTPTPPTAPACPASARNVGVSFTQDMTGEFFGTFLIPSIVHQDPHYHRMPNAAIPRRIGHAILQVAWTQGDNGKGMLNYANLVGFAIDDEISNLYVPGRHTNLPASSRPLRHRTRHRARRQLHHRIPARRRPPHPRPDRPRPAHHQPGRQDRGRTRRTITAAAPKPLQS